jgi:hypothetical protein
LAPQDRWITHWWWHHAHRRSRSSPEGTLSCSLHAHLLVPDEIDDLKKSLLRSDSLKSMYGHCKFSASFHGCLHWECSKCSFRLLLRKNSFNFLLLSHIRSTLAIWLLWVLLSFLFFRLPALFFYFSHPRIANWTPLLEWKLKGLYLSFHRP